MYPQTYKVGILWVIRTMTDDESVRTYKEQLEVTMLIETDSETVAMRKAIAAMEEDYGHKDVVSVSLGPDTNRDSYAVTVTTKEITHL